MSFSTPKMVVNVCDLIVRPGSGTSSTFKVNNFVVFFCFYSTACEKMYFPQSLSEARASFLVNLAGVYSLRSEFDKARKCLQQVTL